VRGEVVAVLERKLLRAAGFDRHGQLEACLPDVPGDIGAELLVHEDAEAPPLSGMPLARWAPAKISCLALRMAASCSPVGWPWTPNSVRRNHAGPSP